MMPQTILSILSIFLHSREIVCTQAFSRKPNAFNERFCSAFLLFYECSRQIRIISKKQFSTIENTFYLVIWYLQTEVVNIF